MKTLTLILIAVGLSFAQEASKPPAKAPAKAAEKAPAPPKQLEEKYTAKLESISLRIENLTLQAELRQKEFEDLQKQNQEVVTNACKESNIELPVCYISRVDPRTGQPAAKGVWMIRANAPAPPEEKK